jgi:carbamoyltransferase
MSAGPLVLGISGAYHETAAALVQGGRVLYAIEEERLSRTKHGKRARIDNPDELPWRAVEETMYQTSTDAQDLDAVVYGLVPGRRQLTVGIDPPDALDPAQGWGTAEGEARFEAALRRVPSIVAERLAIDPGRFHFVPHHVAHAASAFYTSSFEEASVLVLDGIGEDAVGWLGMGKGGRLEQIEEIPYPHSLGFLWERFAVFLGFDEYDAAKVMGLAAYGDPDRFRHEISLVLDVDRDAGCDLPYRVNLDIVRFRAPDVAGLEELFGPRRQPGEPPTDPRFSAIARSLQEQTNRALLAVAQRLAEKSGLRNLCYAGGVALNCVANAELERKGPFCRLCIVGAAHDAGTAIGAALEISLRMDPGRRALDGLGRRADLGPEIIDGEAESAFRQVGLSYERVADPVETACNALVRGEVVGWAQGRMEFGPRALGRRSILVDPRSREVRDRLNRMIKHREPFRPFGASVLEEDLPDWFELPGDNSAGDTRRLMLLAYPVAESRRARIPAVVHQDGTCRVQTVEKARDGLYYDLISRFHKRTGVPLVLNTSFNDREPIVCRPADVVETAIKAGLDLLVMGHFAARCNHEPTRC